MTERVSDLRVAGDLIERAMVILDNIGESRSAYHLQFALDILIDAPIPTTANEIDVAEHKVRFGSAAGLLNL